MIKTKINNEYKDIIKIFGGGTLQKEITKVWSREANKYVYESEVEYTGTLPITITADGNSLLDYKIYGNTVQAGTPTPENPVDVVGCGERFDITGLSEPLCGIGTYTDSLDLSTGILTRRIKKLVLTGEETWLLQSINSYGIANIYTVLSERYSDPLVGLSSHFNIQTTLIADTPTEGFYLSSFEVLYIRIDETRASTARELKSYLAAQYAAGTPVTVWYILEEPEVSTIPVPSGLTGTIEGYLIQDGTPTPETPIYPTANGVKQADDTYSIPYGYKLPMLSNSTVTNIYLGEVQTTRRIKKLVLDGTEDWRTLSEPNYTYAAPIMPYLVKTTAISSHFFQRLDIYLLVSGSFMLNNGNELCIKYNNKTSVDTFKQFLAQQYAAGTPVTVWYVLAEPETGIVNEPLMKIGDYADTIDSTQAAAQIPTFADTTVIDYDGTPKPSQMYIKYRR